MKKRWFKTTFVIIMLISTYIVAWSEENNDIFSITPAFSFAWYPYANISNENSTNTEVDLNNFGVSGIMSLKLFDRVGAHLNLKIDDPTFQKLVDFVGYVTASYFMLKFDYHSFGGNVTWVGSTPNPISNGVYNFRNKWVNVSLLFRVDQLKINNRFLYDFFSHMKLIGAGNLGAIGVGYARYDIPLEYRVQQGREFSNPGLGLFKGESWGFIMLWDTLSWNMERSSSSRGILGLMQYIWIYIDFFGGLELISKGELDTQAIAWMSNFNNGVSIEENIKPHYSVAKVNIGLQHVWDIGKKSRIGFAVGVELLEETIRASNNDINISYKSMSIGPVIRVSANL